MWDRPNVSPRIDDVEMQGRRTRPTVIVLVAMLCLVASCTAPTPERQPEATHSATTSPIELERAIGDYIANGSVALGTINSVIVEVDGISQLELYRNGGGPNHYSHVWSVTKSVVSTLVGIAIAEGKISSLDATLPELLPDHAAKMSPDQRSITLRQLLTMSAGFSDEMGGPQLSDAKVASILKLPLEATPGTRFIYSDPGAQLVSAIVTEATGMTTLDYARAKLFGPLGINSTPAYTGVALWQQIGHDETLAAADFAWAVTEDGINNGCCTLKLKPADMQKIGRLYLDHGQWEGRPLLPAEWVQLATTPSETSSEYGLFWWLESLGGRQAFAAEGRGGQLIAVVPETRMVIAVSTTPTQDMELSADDVIYMINTLITR
jgi:CubicO group peptidase (beta-lactamase class C family)